MSSSHRLVCTGSLASADRVVMPRKCSAPLVITGTTWAPASTSRRQTSTALYAAMPPVTPRTMRLPASMDVLDVGVSGDGVVAGLVGGGLVFGVGKLDPHDLVGGDLFEPDAQRLAGNRADLRRNHVAEAVTELVEVGVDLTGTACRERDQG